MTELINISEPQDEWDILRDCIVYAIVNDPKVTKDKIKRNPEDMKQWLLENNLNWDSFMALTDKEKKKKIEIICETKGGTAGKINRSFLKIFKDKKYDDLKNDIDNAIPAWFKLYDPNNDDIIIDMDGDNKNNDNNNDDIKVDITGNKDILAKCIVSIIKHAKYNDTDGKADAFTSLNDDEITNNILGYNDINDVKDLQLKDKKEQKKFFENVLKIKKGPAGRVWKYFNQNFNDMNSDEILTKYEQDCKPLNVNSNNNNDNNMDYDNDMKYDDIKMDGLDDFDVGSRVNFQHTKDYQTFADDASKTLTKVGKAYLTVLADEMDSNRISGEILLNEAQNGDTFIDWYERHIRKKGRTNRVFILLFKEYILKNENIVRDLKYNDNGDNQYYTFMETALELIVRDKVLSLKKDTDYMYNQAEYKEFADVFVEDCGLPEGIAIKLTCTMRAEQD